MSKIGIDPSTSVNYPDKNIVKTKNTTDTTSHTVPSPYNKDTSFNTSKPVISENPFGKSINSTNTKPVNWLEDALKSARERNDSKALFDISVIQYEKNVIPGVKASDIFREAYETALSEMDSETLYDIGNFDASHQLLPDVSSEFIFKMADMTRRIY